MPNRVTADNAYELVGGVWSCKTFAGNPLQHTFRRDEDAVSLIAETTVEFNGRTGKMNEVYRFHRDHRNWEVSLVDGKFIARAAPWLGSKWTFEGNDSENGAETRVRIVYTSPNVASYRREFERFVGGTWQTYAGEQCSRRPS